MEKIVKNIWVRLIACILCASSCIGIVASVFGMVLFSAYPDMEELLKDGNERIMENYAMYVMLETDADKLNSFLDNTNMYISIDEKTYEGADSDTPVVNRIYSNMPSGVDVSYQIDGMKLSECYGYNVSTVLGALCNSYQRSYWEYTISTPLQGYVFDVNTGLFYYVTADGYFKATYVDVCRNGEYYDYNLIVRGEKEIYYNSFYGITLDTTEYEEWDWVRLSGKRMGLTEQYGSNVIQLVSDSAIIDEKLRTENYEVEYFSINYVSDKITTYNVTMAMDSTLAKDDLFAEWQDAVCTMYGYQDDLSWILWVCVITLICGIVLLAVSAPAEKEKLRIYHKIPVLIFTGMVAAVEILLGLLVLLMCELHMDSGSWVISTTEFAMHVESVVAVMLLILFTYLANIMTRIRTKTFFRYSELYYICRPILFLYRGFRENISLIWKGLIPLALIAVAEFLVIICFYWDAEALLTFFFLFKLVEIPVVLFGLAQMKRLQQGSKRIASGDLTPIDTKGMFWEFKKHGENINQIRDGITVAVEEQIKSERFKTELITNVSHDIKTPLTSIINYVDLIKKEEITDPTMIEYVDVLDRQSARLKKLIEDLMEASKASTGNLEVQLEECDMGVLLSQVVGEFEEKLGENGLEAVVSKPEESVMAMVDGRHVWRVLDNLLNNVCKYSQPNTRVYILLEQDANEVAITFKNISKMALNIPSDQLMQRFVRGDSSRHTEGSGLGLSIAQSLTELMNGSMKLDIDGDLFKVTLKFNRVV